MRAFRILFAALLATVCPLQAQEQNSEIIQVSPDKFLRWHGHAGRTYFVQVSDPNDHLRNWTWAPIVETGNDEDISYEVDGTADKAFFRLWFTDEPTADPDGDDFDGDGLTNWDEVSTHQTNPLKWDSDDDGLPDDWEIDWKGTIEVDLSHEDRGDWQEGDWREALQEALDDEPYHFSSSEVVFVKDWTIVDNVGWVVTIEAQDIEIK